MFNKKYSKKDFEYFFRPEDPNSSRLLDCVSFFDLGDLEKQVLENKIILHGYADDRGVVANGGRLGANNSPKLIRDQLYLLVKNISTPKIFDLGDFLPDNKYLYEDQNKLISLFQKNLIPKIKNNKLLSIGGGHDWAAVDFAKLPKDTILINLDAHLDMRPNAVNKERKSHSGTPFRSIIDSGYPGENLFVFGLQEHCNSLQHLKWAKDQGVNLFFLNQKNAFLNSIKDIIKKNANLKIALSLDLDCFAQHIAPGVSAPQAFGVDVEIVNSFIKKYKKIITKFGIYEYNPSFDRDLQTARLATKLIYNWI